MDLFLTVAVVRALASHPPLFAFCTATMTERTGQANLKQLKVFFRGSGGIKKWYLECRTSQSVPPFQSSLSSSSLLLLLQREERPPQPSPATQSLGC